MKHLKDFFKKKEEGPLTKYAPVGTKHCEAKCNRSVVRTPDGPVIVCDACNRIVIDNR